MNTKIQSALSKVAPDISFSLEYTEDPHFRWDGDGPDPAEDGYVPYDIDVFARAIDRGQMIEGRTSLGGTYEKPGKFDPDIGGYLPQMLEEAVSNLLEEGGKKLSRSVGSQGRKAIAWLKTYMRETHKARG